MNPEGNSLPPWGGAFRRTKRRGPFIVAIDGPAGAGKSTASRRVAARLGFAMVDTGAIYRTVALAASRAGIAFDDSSRLAELLPKLDIRFDPQGSQEGSGSAASHGLEAAGALAGQRVFLDEEDVSLAFCQAGADNAVSAEDYA